MTTKPISCSRATIASPTRFDTFGAVVIFRTATYLLFTAVGFADPSTEKEIRNRIKAVLFVGTELSALDPESHGSFEPEPGIVAERVSYGTQFGMRVPGIVYRPKVTRTKAPGIIVVNGHGGDKFSWYAMYAGILYARAGAFVLTYDPTGEGERNADRKSGTRAQDKVEGLPELSERLGGPDVDRCNARGLVS
jgi:hypothetical protein